NFWETTLSYVRDFASYDDEEQGIVGLYRRPGGHTVTARIQTDERRVLYASLLAGYERDDLRKSSFLSQVAMTYRPTSWMELNPAIYYQRTRDEEAWVYPDGNILDPVISPEPFSVFADRDVEFLDLSMRGIVTFTRDLSFQFFTQVFWARGNYDRFRRLANPGLLLTYDYPSQSGYYDHNFNSVTLNANVLLRWEYMPGSTLYLVWTQARYGDNGMYNQGLQERFGDAFRLPRQDVVLMKMTYWFPL
ncbi:MAG: hypothetical protein IT282_04725, partial [Bacteroidetes bacterium]|nr:hypothetical protein [Bacteroidota bacterium]